MSYYGFIDLPSSSNIDHDKLISLHLSSSQTGCPTNAKETNPHWQKRVLMAFLKGQVNQTDSQNLNSSN